MNTAEPRVPRRNPVNWFFAGAAISFLFSVFLWFFVDKEAGIFVGIWVPSILSLAAAVQRS